MSKTIHENIQHTAENQCYDDIRNNLSNQEIDRNIKILKDFLRSNPDHAEAHNDIAVLYYRQGNLLQTLGHYEKAVRLAPNNTTFRRNLASFYFVEMGWTDEAIFIFTEILDTHPSSIDTLSALANISIALGRTGEALIFLRRIQQLEPSNKEALDAIQRLESGNVDILSAETPSPAKEGPASAPEMDTILAGLHETLSRLETVDSSQESYRKALSAMQHGDEESAVTLLMQLVDLDPSFALAHNDLGVIFQQRGDFEKSRYHHELAVKEDPSSITFRKNLAGLYFSELDRTDDAIFLLTEILRTHPNDVETLSGLSQIALTLGRTEEAATFLEKISKLEPCNNEARELLDQLRNDNNGFFLASN
ncbi:MAG TPA: tetratricopeptide repeat protein [Geobacteraceae bacterium]|nr:tetratricopeptide repeat protein [Geobacteraceae bacterium]